MPGYNNDSVQTIQNRYAGIQNLLRRDQNREDFNRNRTGSPGLGTANQYWNDVPTKMSPAAKQAMMNRAATRTTAAHQGASDRIREAAARGGWGNSAVVPSLIAGAEHAKNAQTQQAMTDVELHADDVARKYGLAKAQGYGNFALGQESLDLNRRAQDSALEREYQRLLYQMDRDQAERGWRENVYRDSRDRQEFLDDRYDDSLDYDRGVDNREWELFQDQKREDDRMKEILMRQMEMRYPELFRDPNERSALGVSYG